jgi:hypothetical protein
VENGLAVSFEYDPEMETPQTPRAQ